MKTELQNRTLWYDGTNDVSAELVPELFFTGVLPSNIIVREPSGDTYLFNSLSDEEIKSAKDSNNPFDMTWNIPKEYSNLDLDQAVQEKLLGFSKEYQVRAVQELQEIKNRKLENVFRSLVYIVDFFKQTNQIWGVGRGSSCACLILFLIGLHKVDPVKYNIPMSEFFHD